jgi:hypothetical protein
MKTGKVEHPPPRSHLSGTLDLIDRLAALAPASPYLAHVRRLLDRPDVLPEFVAPTADNLKYDVYCSEGPSGGAWGVTINDCHEQDSWFGEVERFVLALSANYRLPLARALYDSAPAGSRFTLGIGFDHPEMPPRLKLYLQEARWARSALTAADVAHFLESNAPGYALPAWISRERAIGVFAVELLPDDKARFKLYVGGRTARAAAQGAPEEVTELARIMDETCPLPALWHYVTVRLSLREPPRHALNKIYNPVEVRADKTGQALAAAWHDVELLFARAGRKSSFQRLSELLRAAPELYVVPTATALEDQGRSADVYCAAWR